MHRGSIIIASRLGIIGISQEDKIREEVCMMNRSDFNTSALWMRIYGEANDCVAVLNINPGRVMIEIDDRVLKNVMTNK